MTIRAGLLALALVALPGCDAIESVVDTLSQPSAEELAAIRTVFDCDVAAVSSSGSRTGTLAGGDCRFNDGSLVDLYAFRVTGETNIRVTMESSVFTPYVLLYTANGGQLQQVGAENGQDTVTLSYLVNAGTYVVGANSNDANETGAYTVRIERR